MKQKYISDREKVKGAITEIVKNKKKKGVEPVFATVGDIVSHTEMCMSDVNCELSIRLCKSDFFRNWLWCILHKPILPQLHLTASSVNIIKTLF